MPMLPSGNVTFFSMRSNNINLKLLPDHVFEQKRGTTLKTLLFLETKINKVSQNAFHKMSNLEILQISGRLLHLKPGIFRNLTKLIDLDLQKNLLEIIPDADICGAYNIISLNMNKNKLHALHMGTCFKNLTKLKEICFGNNPVKYISVHDFTSLKTLQIRILDLSGCQLRNLKQGVLEGFSQLKQIYLQDNLITYFEFQFSNISPLLNTPQLDGIKLNTISGRLFANLTNLRTLNLASTGLKKMELPYQFQELTRLSSMTLSANHLNILSNDSFNNLKSTMVSYLVLFGCSLSQITAGALEPFPNLTVLNLGHNKLTAKNIQIGLYGIRETYALQYLIISGNYLSNLNGETFKNLRGTQLKHIFMSNCDIKEIVSGVFHHLRHLETADLSKNQITILHENAFPRGSTLSSLTLKSNRLYSIPDATSINTENLEKLHLENNGIKSVTVESLRGYKRLKYLILRWNQIKLQRGCFNSSFALEILDLRSNRLSGDIRNELLGLKHIHELFLCDNNIENFSIIAFSASLHLNHLELAGNPLLEKNIIGLSKAWNYLINLHYLDLSRNRISYLPQQILKNLSKLQSLVLSNNDLSNWNPTVFKKQGKLLLLTLNNNKINYVTREHFQYLVSLRELSMSGNPFICTCNLLELITWIQHPRGIYFSGVQEYRCESPKEWARKSLLDFNISEDDCQSYFWVDIIIASVVIYIFLVTVTTVAYRNRWYIRFVTFRSSKIKHMVKFFIVFSLHHLKSYEGAEVESDINV